MSERQVKGHDSEIDQLQQIETGVAVLQRRQNRLMVMAVATSTLALISFVSIFFQQDMVLGLFGVSEQVRQLHVPFSVNAQFEAFLHQPNYFLNLLSWFGWLILKLIVAFTGAFISVSLLKKIRFFRIRFQSFVLKFVGWLVAFIVLWSGLTYVQYDLEEDEASEYQALVSYDQSIQQSHIYQYLQRTEDPEPVKDYVLAQTALLHKPQDRDVAVAYTAKLIQAERKDPHFLEYGLKPEQLWSMQYQLYGQAVTPLAQSVEPLVEKASRWSSVLNYVLYALIAVSVLISGIFYFLSRGLKKRLVRISQKLQY